MSRIGGHNYTSKLSTVPRKAHLAIKGYPREKGQVDRVREKLTNLVFYTDALHHGPDPRPGLYSARYLFQDEEVPPVANHDGMCGSPWVVAKCQASEWISLLAGIHVEGGQGGNREYQAIFIGADVDLSLLVVQRKSRRSFKKGVGFEIFFPKLTLDQAPKNQYLLLP